MSQVRFTDEQGPHSSDPLKDFLVEIHKSFERGDLEGNRLLKYLEQYTARFSSEDLATGLSLLLNNVGELKEAASRSYLHGNGFYKIVLGQSAYFCLRLHIWVPGNHSQENLHGHRWPFISKVLTGTIENELWGDALSAAAKEYDEYIYTDKNAPLKFIGRAKVHKTEIQKINAGTTYRMESESLHRIFVPSDEIVSTLMLHPSPTRVWTRNIIINDSLPDAVPSYMNEQELSAILRTYIQHLRIS